MAPRKKAEEAPVPAAETPASEAPAATPSKATSTAILVKYRDHKGEATERTFSRDVHGDNFADLADEFKKTNASKVIE